MVRERAHDAGLLRDLGNLAEKCSSILSAGTVLMGRPVGGGSVPSARNRIDE